MSTIHQSIPITPPSATLSLPAVSPFAPFNNNTIDYDTQDQSDTETERDIDASGSPYNAPSIQSSQTVQRQNSRLSVALSLASMEDHLSTTYPKDMSGTPVIAPCWPLSSEERPETKNNQSLSVMAVSPHLASSPTLGMANTQAPSAPVESSPMLIPTPHNISIHPSSTVSSRYSVGTFGPSPESKSRARFSRSTATDSEVGTTRSNSSRRRRPISMLSAFDAHHEPSIASSPPATACASTGRRPSAALEADEDAAIQDLLMDLSRRNPIRIVPARRDAPGSGVDEFGNVQAITPSRRHHVERHNSYVRLFSAPVQD